MDQDLEIRIRPCVPEDAAALTLVGRSTYLETYAGIVPGPDLVRYCAEAYAEAQHAAWLAKPDHRLWLAEAPRGAPVGFAVLTPANLPVEPEPGDIELKRIYLLRRFHGLGVGAALMRAVVEQARQMGGRRLLLGVFEENARAIAFYARQGFDRLGTRKFRVGEIDYSDLVLARSLS